jgi:hypothetical protein
MGYPSLKPILMKKEFLISECFMLSVNAAFQRANVYEDSSSDMRKVYLKRMIKGYIDNNIISQYDNEVSEINHIENIKSVSEYSKCFEDILANGQLNFGVSQKLLNLYLKYMWCLGVITIPPPHFPVDSIIQKKLKLKVIPWTKMKNEKDYLKVINHAKTILSDYNYKTIAELELALFKRN